MALVVSIVVLPAPIVLGLRDPRRRARRARAAAASTDARLRSSRAVRRPISAPSSVWPTRSLERRRPEECNDALPPLRPVRARGLRSRASAPGPWPATGGARSTTRPACSTPPSTPGSTSSTPRPSTATTASARRCSPTSCKAHRDEIVLTTKCGYDIDGRAEVPGPVRASARLATRVDPRQLEDSLRRLGIDHIDLYQLHNPRIEPILADDLWAELEALRAEGKIRELGVALGPAIGWVEEGLSAIRDRDIVSLQTVFNILEQEPGLTFAARAQRRRGPRRPHLARPARVRHAVGQGHARHRVPARATTARTATATTCSTTSTRPTTLAFLWEGTGRTIGPGRDRRHPRQPGVHDRAARPASTVDEVARVRRRVRPSAHRRRDAPASTSSGPTTSDHEPLRDAAEVERLSPSMAARLPADQRRRQLLDIACGVFADTGFHATSMDDIAARRRGHQAGPLPALRVEARAVRRGARRRRRPAPRASSRRPPRRRPPGRDARRGRLRRLLPVRHRERAPRSELLFGASARNDAEFAEIVDASSTRLPTRSASSSRSRARPNTAGCSPTRSSGSPRPPAATRSPTTAPRSSRRCSPAGSPSWRGSAPRRPGRRGRSAVAAGQAKGRPSRAYAAAER